MCHVVWYAASERGCWGVIWRRMDGWMELQNRLSEQVVQARQGKRRGKVLPCLLLATV